MIRLSLGNNSVAPTLAEKTTISNPVYLFEFINSQSQEKFYCIAADISIYPDRYNKFLIKVKTSPNALLGEIDLQTADEYSYTVYAQHSTTNIDPLQAIEIVETGMMIYDKTMTARSEYTSAQTTRKVYEP